MTCVRTCARICVAAIAEVLEAAAIVLLAATIVTATAKGTSTDGRIKRMNTTQMKCVAPVTAVGDTCN